MIKEYIKGSILNAPQKYIAHGVNCQNVMGSGVAKVLFEEYPMIKAEYHRLFGHFKKHNIKHDPKSLLGGVDEILFGDDQVHDGVFNLFTQEYYGYDGQKYVSYDAIYDCFQELASYDDLDELAIPKIGCGLAGGNWNIVSQIIDDATGDDLDVYVYYLE